MKRRHHQQHDDHDEPDPPEVEPRPEDNYVTLKCGIRRIINPQYLKRIEEECVAANRCTRLSSLVANVVAGSMADKYTRWVYNPLFYLSCCDALFADRVPTPSGQTRPNLRKGFPLPLQEKIDECCCCLLKPQATKRGREIKGSLCPLWWSDPKKYGTTHNLSQVIVFWARQMAESVLKWVKESIPIYKFRLQRYGGDLLKLDGCKNGFSTIREISNQLNAIGQLIGDKKDSSESV
ncbi:hypothetical protein ADUPG1_000820, partial [Aduncisulcus paluster]